MPNRNAIASLRAAREAEERGRMTHEAWAPPEELTRARKWLTGPIATDDYGNEIPGDSSSLSSLMNSLVPHPGQPEEQIAANTLGFMLPGGGIRAARDLARGPVGESVVYAIGGAGRRGAIGATKKELEAAQKNAAEMLGLPANNTPADRARALARVDDPLWRGGKPPSEAGEMRNQHWFSRDKSKGEGFARQPGNELGKYVMLKSAERFAADSFAPLRGDHAARIAEALRRDGYDKLAKDFLQAGADGDLPLSHVAWILKSRTGGEAGMRKYLRAIGFDAVDDGTDIAVTGWGKGVMRDPQRAAFDPARLGDPSVYAGIAGLGALPLLTREREEY